MSRMRSDTAGSLHPCVTVVLDHMQEASDNIGTNQIMKH